MLDGDRDQRGPRRSERAQPHMSKNVKIALIILGLGAVVAIAVILKRDKTIVDKATDKITETIDELDPAARAAVVARLGIDAKDKIVEATDRLVS